MLMQQFQASNLHACLRFLVENLPKVAQPLVRAYQRMAH